jgi:hypothetical protein
MEKRDLDCEYKVLDYNEKDNINGAMLMFEYGTINCKCLQEVALVGVLSIWSAMRSKWVFIMLASGFFISACVDPIDLNLPGDRDYLVINGQVTNLSESYVVSIKRSSDFTTDQTPKETPVSGAKVYVTGQDQTMGIFTEKDPGFYMSDPAQFIGEIGNSYKLTVELKDETRYESTFETIQPVPETGEVHFDVITKAQLNEVENIVYQKKVQVSTDVLSPYGLEQVFLIWELEGEYEFNEQKPLSPGETNKTCYVKDDLLLGGRTIFDASLVKSNQASNQILIELDMNYKLASAYCVHIKQQSISANAFSFWTAAKDLNENNGNLLDQLPGRIRGNMSNPDQPDEQIFGYFYASAVHQERKFVPKEIVLSQPAPCPANDVIFTGLCYDCLIIKNSTLSKPFYWR